MLATIPSAVLIGVDGRQVSVEVHVSNGLPGFTVVGLPDAAVRESRDRVRAALLSSGLPWPLRRVTVNLAPSGVRKGGAGVDLPIAIGLLVASGTIDPAAATGLAFCGELGLDGALRAVPGAVVIVEALRGHTVVVPLANVNEAYLAGADRVRAAATLRQVVDALQGRRPWPTPDPTASAPPEDDAAQGPWPPRRWRPPKSSSTPPGSWDWSLCQAVRTICSPWAAPVRSLQRSGAALCPPTHASTSTASAEER